MEENQYEYIDKVFKLLLSKCDLAARDKTHKNHDITRYVNPIPYGEGENISRHRTMDLIQYQM